MEYCNSSLVIDGVLLIRYNSRSVLSKNITDVLKKLASDMGTNLLKLILENV